MIFLKKNKNISYLKNFIKQPIHLFPIFSYLENNENLEEKISIFKNNLNSVNLMEKKSALDFSSVYNVVWDFYYRAETKWYFYNNYDISFKQFFLYYMPEITYFLLFLFIIFLMSIKNKKFDINYLFFMLIGSIVAPGFSILFIKSSIEHLRLQSLLSYWNYNLEFLNENSFNRVFEENFLVNYSWNFFCSEDFIIGRLLFNNLYIVDYFSIFFKGFLVFCSFLFFFVLLVLFYTENFLLFKFKTNLFVDKNLNFLKNFLLISSISHFFLLNLISAYDLISLFVALEGTTLCLYILAGLRVDNRLSVEAGLKYFLVSGVFSCIFGFGSFLVYFVTKHTNFYHIRESITVIINEYSNQEFNLFYVALFLGILSMVIVFLMKLGSVPYHFWIGDIYQGSPLIVTIFFATIVRISFFAIFFRLIYYVFFFMSLNQIYLIFLFIFGFVSILYGGIQSLAQTEIKRFLAYSSIVHTGFIFLCLSAMTVDSIKASILYTVVYIFTLLCFFLVLLIQPAIFKNKINNKEVFLFRTPKSFSDLKKLPISFKFILIFLLFSMAGLPPFPGFIIKLYALKSFFFEFIYSFKIYLILDVVPFSFYIIFFLFFCIVLLSLLTGYNYIRLINKMSFSEEKDLEEKPMLIKTYISSYNFRQHVIQILFFFIFIINIFLIFFISYYYNQEQGTFETLYNSLRHPFYNLNTMFFEMVNVDYGKIIDNKKYTIIEPLNMIQNFYSNAYFIEDFQGHWEEINYSAVNRLCDSGNRYFSVYRFLYTSESKDFLNWDIMNTNWLCFVNQEILSYDYILLEKKLN